jgi:Uma2 family endonuclease
MATTVAAPAVQRIVLHDVSWETYEHLLADHIDSSAPRFTYDRGELEIVSLSTEHERANRTIALLVEEVAVEWDIDVLNVGSMTFKREDLQRGVEPDSSFYVQNEERVRGRSQIDPAVDPPPDLVIEIEITQLAIPKLPIYAEFGIREVWRFDGERVGMLQLAGGQYRPVDSSEALPLLTAETVTEFMRLSTSLRRTEWMRQLRDWGRAQARS